MRRFRWTALALLLPLIGPAPAGAQDGNIMMAVDSVERRLAVGPFEVVDHRPSRGLEDERTARVTLSFPDGSVMPAKWAPAARGGESFNNVPRFELAAYLLQTLFLEESEYVVPPTVIRAFPLASYREVEPEAGPTFPGTDAVLVVLQYWLWTVTDEGFWDPERFATDSVYARHFANFNILTYLIRHSDENKGNYLISEIPENPRVFSVDNGVSFSSPPSDRGHRWRRLRIDRLPAATVNRLRALTPEDLTRLLETVAEFRVHEDGSLEPVSPGPNIFPRRGVRQADGRVQMGLTQQEIGELWGRIHRLVRDVERGRLEVF